MKGFDETESCWDCTKQTPVKTVYKAGEVFGIPFVAILCDRCVKEREERSYGP